MRHELALLATASVLLFLPGPWPALGAVLAILALVLQHRRIRAARVDAEMVARMIRDEHEDWPGTRRTGDDDRPGVNVWWAIAGDELLAALRRVADGEDPDLVYAELYANSDHESVEGDT